MSEHVGDPPSARTVVVSFPDGETEYWLTDQAFSSGETIRRNGRAWVVADVLHPARGGYLKVKLREVDGKSRRRAGDPAGTAGDGPLPDRSIEPPSPG